MQSQTIRQFTSAHTAFSLCRHPTRPLLAHPSRPSLRLVYPRLPLLLSLMLLAGLSGCGPSSSDNAPNLGPHANVGGQSLTQKSLSPHNDPTVPATSAMPLLSDHGTGSASGAKTVVGGENTSQADRQLLTSADASNDNTDGRDQSPVSIKPSIPDSIVTGLDSPDARVRLLTLDHWTEPKPTASLDLLFAALDDEDEAVRAKATEIIERRWAAEQGQN